jgi:hypothetical protein
MMYKPSTFYCLEPKGVETLLAESITSYIIRLATKHHLLVYVLLKEIIVPLLGKAYLHSADGPVPHRLSSKWFRQTASQMTGVNQSTQEWITVLETLTQHHDLSYLSMILWADTIAYRGLVRPFQAWCPHCYSDMHQNGGEVYNPLAWSLQDTGACLKHGFPLQDRCPFPDCQKQFPLLISKGCVGYCPACFRWLGSLSVYPAFIEALPSAIKQSQMIGELIAAAPNLLYQPQSTIFAETIQKLTENLFDGNSKALAQFLEVNHKTVYMWRDNEQIPQLKTLLRLCEKINISPLQLLTGYMLRQTPQLLTLSIQKIPETRQPKKRYRVFNKEAIRKKLIEIYTSENPPQPMQKIAKSLGYDHSYLIRKFPRLCHQISEKFHIYVEQQRQNIQNISHKHLETAILNLHAESLYPSHRRLRKDFGGKMRSPILRGIRKRILRQLHYV